MIDDVQAQNEVQSLNRKVQLLEDSNEQLETRLKTAVANLDEATKVVDEHERYAQWLMAVIFHCQLQMITYSLPPYPFHSHFHTTLSLIFFLCYSS